MSPSNKNSKPRGRPKKYATIQQAEASIRQQRHARYIRTRRQHSAEFIPYEPTLPTNVPRATPSNIGLRISPEIQVPPAIAEEEEEELPAERIDYADLGSFTPLLTADNEAETTRQIEQAQAMEREQAPEQEEREAAIQDQLKVSKRRATDLLSEISGSNADADGTIPGTARGAEKGTNYSSSSAGEVVGQERSQAERVEATPQHQRDRQRGESVGTQSPLAEPSERTAFKLAKQLRNFQGCTHEQHREADAQHHEHHLRADVHSACSSLPTITSLLYGGQHESTRLPDVLSNPKLMKPMDVRGVDCKSIFEGTSLAALPEEAGTADKGLPRSLCLSQHHTKSRKKRGAQTTFDVDSICCFPSSLGVARRGIYWYPKPHAFLNLNADIHFAMRVPAYNSRGDLVEREFPLHHIPHYCFGSVIGMESLLLFVFFPALRLESQYKHTTYLSNNDQELWLDAVLNPALTQVIGSSNIVQHYPASAHVAGLDATAVSAESLARKQSAREQLLKYALQPQYLDALWECVLERIQQNPGLCQFAGATLFMHAKNTKLEYMGESLPAACGRFEACWNQVADAQFYSRQRTFVDMAKQVTSEDSALPYDAVGDDQEAEVFLWKRCCLAAYARSREVRLADGSRGKGSPKRTTYPWATMRDTEGLTLFAAPRGKESMDGLIYSQCYGLIKTPFDTSKTYVFSNEAMENLALDPGYVQSLQQEGGSRAFSKAACEFGYLHSKKRAYANVRDSRWKSYGIREEHRISMSLLDEVCEQWREWDLYDDLIDDADLPLPYYIIPTQDVLAFLSAQVNKYCFLFEHTLAHAAKVYSLPETMVMVVALRALRFCYGSSLLQRESLLYKDRWEKRSGQQVVVKEGLGFGDTMERCGLGWFLPKFNWATRRLAAPHGDNILVGNLLMHTEYKRRWQAVKDLRDVYVRFNQAEAWYTQYRLDESPRRVEKWLEYLHALNLQQFDADVWKTVLAAHKRNEELSPGAIEQGCSVGYSYHGMRDMFVVDGAAGPPHLVTGNKMRFTTIDSLLQFLFLWEDGQERIGWANKPYRAIVQKSHALVERLHGYRAAEDWLDEFFHLVRLTHWILPYPSNTALVASTKTSRAQGLQRRTMWFSVVYKRAEGVVETNPHTLFHILRRAERETFGESEGSARQWDTKELIRACGRQGVAMYGDEQGNKHWVAGKRSIGAKGFAPTWERGRPHRLAMLEQIQDKSLEELEEMAVAWTRDTSVERETEREAPGALQGSIRDFFTQPGRAASGLGSRGEHDGRVITGSSSSGSRFVPSRSSSSL
jgi:hypothetical protein